MLDTEFETDRLTVQDIIGLTKHFTPEAFQAFLLDKGGEILTAQNADGQDEYVRPWLNDNTRIIEMPGDIHVQIGPDPVQVLIVEAGPNNPDTLKPGFNYFETTVTGVEGYTPVPEIEYKPAKTHASTRPDEAKTEGRVPKGGEPTELPSRRSTTGTFNRNVAEGVDQFIEDIEIDDKRTLSRISSALLNGDVDIQNLSSEDQEFLIFEAQKERKLDGVDEDENKALEGLVGSNILVLGDDPASPAGMGAVIVSDAVLMFVRIDSDGKVTYGGHGSFFDHFDPEHIQGHIDYIIGRLNEVDTPREHDSDDGLEEGEHVLDALETAEDVPLGPRF